jgi:hypothetical protein
MKIEAQAKQFLETIELAIVGTLTKEDVLKVGRTNLPSVVAAFEEGHPCLMKSQLIGDVQWAFLHLVREAVGTVPFFRVPHPQVHPKLMIQYVSDLLYPSPTEKEMSDEELRFAKERFGGIHKRISWRVNRILSDRKATRSLPAA